MLLAFSYPFMRITYWLNIFKLLLIGECHGPLWAMSFDILYTSFIFWTLSTRFMEQDVWWWNYRAKSTSIKFKKYQVFIGSCYFSADTSVLFVKYVGINFFIFFLLMFFLTLVYQVKIFKKEKQESCLVAFRTNNISGLILFFSIYLL